MDAVHAVIEPYEAALRAAMLTNDVDALDTLLDDHLVFTIPSGLIISKYDDLSAHRAKLLRLDTLDIRKRSISAVAEFVEDGGSGCYGLAPHHYRTMRREQVTSTKGW
ncbi:nuclear transport factor 2 family protein [Burkholderia territorii]|uniref:nuclear transport factor 2 family protein n=1 Tax=Burkholderia territorii TaxID=1503055 RepID=UPI000A51898C|nr:nuclear transport factor 2 family protein [Burkholderia territorii]